jgi:hypothetical protein
LFSGLSRLRDGLQGLFYGFLVVADVVFQKSFLESHSAARRIKSALMSRFLRFQREHPVVFFFFKKLCSKASVCRSAFPCLVAVSSNLSSASVARARRVTGFASIPIPQEPFFFPKVPETFWPFQIAREAVRPEPPFGQNIAQAHHVFFG